MELYYEAPTDEVFEEIKAAAIRIWQTYDDTFGYSSGKIERVERVENVQDNWMYIIGMFDSRNQALFLTTVSLATADLIRRAINSVQ